MSSISSNPTPRKEEKSLFRMVTDNPLPTLLAAGGAGLVGYNYLNAPKPQSFMQKTLSKIGFGGSSSFAVGASLLAGGALFAPHIAKIWKGNPHPIALPPAPKTMMGGIKTAFTSFGRNASNAAVKYGPKAALTTGAVGAGVGAIALSPFGVPAYSLLATSGASIMGTLGTAGSVLSGLGTTASATAANALASAGSTLAGFGTTATTAVTSGLSSASSTLAGVGITASTAGSAALRIASDTGKNILTKIGLSKVASLAQNATVNTAQAVKEVTKEVAKEVPTHLADFNSPF